MCPQAKVHNLSGSLIRIGRSVPGITNDIDLRPQNISRIHLMVFRDYSAIDGRSLYGTTVNAEFLPYGETRKLRDGDVIALSGEAALTFSATRSESTGRSPAPAVVIDGGQRQITNLGQGANFLKLDSSGRVTISQTGPGDALMSIRVNRDADLGQRISISSNVDGDLSFDAKIDDYNYETYKIPARREYTAFPISEVTDYPFASRVVYHYHDTSFQLVDTVGR